MRLNAEKLDTLLAMLILRLSPKARLLLLQQQVLLRLVLVPRHTDRRDRRRRHCLLLHLWALAHASSTAFLTSSRSVSDLASLSIDSGVGTTLRSPTPSSHSWRTAARDDVCELYWSTTLLRSIVL